MDTGKKAGILLFFLILFCVSKLPAENWDREDKLLLTGYLLTETIDALQTYEILHNDIFHEVNPLIKDDTSLAIYFLTKVSIVMFISHRCPRIRKRFLKANIFIKLNLIGNNFYIGVRF